MDTNCCRFCGLELIPEDPPGDVCGDCLALNPPAPPYQQDMIDFLRKRIADQDKKLNEAFVKEIWLTFQALHK